METGGGGVLFGFGGVCTLVMKVVAPPAPAPAGLALTRGPPAMARPAAWAPWVAAVRPCAPGKRAGLALGAAVISSGGVVRRRLGSCARCGGRWGLDLGQLGEAHFQLLVGGDVVGHLAVVPNAVCPCGQGSPVGLEGGGSAHMSRTRHFCRFCEISCNIVALARYIW